MAVEITNVSISASSFAIGESGTITFTVKNTNVWTARNIEARLERSPLHSSAESVDVVPLGTISLAKNASKTYTRTFTVTSAVQGAFDYYDERAFAAHLTVVLDDGGSNFDGASVSSGATILDLRYVPSIPIFDVERSPAADSTGAAVDIACTLAEGADPEYEGLALTLRWKEEDAASFPAENTLVVTIADALASGGTTVTPSFTFETEKAYTLRATFTDGIDSAVSETKLSKAFKVINVHPTSKNIGEGQFAVSDTSAGLVHDTMYRYKFHEGAEDADGREIIGAVDYSASRVDTGLKWLNGRKIYRKTFIFGSMATSGTLDIPIGESAIEEVVSLRGTVGTSGGTNLELLPFTHQSNVNYQKGLTVSSLANNPFIAIRMGSGATAPVGGYVVIEYVPIDPATQWSKPYMTAASEAGCVVSASSADSASYVALKGFSLSPTECWISTLADAERWIQMQMPGSRTNIVLYICNQNTASEYPSVKSGIFYGSNDGATWDEIGSFSDRPDNLNFALTVHHLKNQTPYSYIRIKITSPGANVDKARIGRISVFGDIA